MPFDIDRRTQTIIFQGTCSQRLATAGCLAQREPHRLAALEESLLFLFRSYKQIMHSRKAAIVVFDEGG